MRVDPHEILQLLGVPEAGRHVYPVAVDCPICRASGKLEVRSPAHAVCRGCHFTGDLIQLLAQSRDEAPERTIHDLRVRSVLDIDEEQYLAARKQRQAIKNLVLKRTQQIREEGLAGSARAVFDRLNCNYSIQDVMKLMPHAVPLSRKEVLDACFDGEQKKLPKTCHAAFKWWGRRTALTVPAWESVDIVGLWLITVQGWSYMPLADRQTYGVGFGLVPSFSDRQLVVMDNIEQALRMTIWSVAERARPMGFIVPHGIHSRIEHCRCGRTVFWSPTGEPAHYLKALDVLDAQTLDHELVGAFNPAREFPCGGSIGRFERLLQEALPAHQAAALQLQRMPVDRARSLIAGFKLTPASRARIVSNLTGDDARHVDQLFEDTLEDSTITWNGRIVSDTPQGWMVEGRVISAAKLYIDKIRPKGQSGEAVCDGTVTFTGRQGERHSLNFRENLTVLRKNTADWIQRLVIAETGNVPYVDSRWSKQLVELAQQFHQPTPVMSDQLYGWDERTLRMPNFVIDAKGAAPMRSMIEGPRLPAPEPLSPAEWEAFRHTSFCRIFLALIGNLVRTCNGRPGIGLMLTHEPHVVNRLAASFGSPIVPDPSPDAISAVVDSPLPMFTEWTTGPLQRMFSHMTGYRHLVLSVDEHTARLAAVSSEWLQLRVGPNVDYQALRAVFLLLPRLIRNQDLELDSDEFYRDIADLVLQDVHKYFSHSRLAVAASELDQHYSSRAGTAATRIMELLFWAINRGDVVPEYLKECVFVPYDQFAAATYSETLALPDYQELNRRLSDARYLIAQRDALVWRRNGWLFSRTVWDVNASLLQASSC